jgi:ATP-dependent Clp protease ATP-binding subunit ClpB
VLFTPLDLGQIKQIVRLLTQELQRRLSEQEIRLEISEPALEHIARSGYDPVYGARPLKRYLQRSVETKIGRALIAGGIEPGARAVVDLENGELQVRLEKGPPRLEALSRAS